MSDVRPGKTQEKIKDILDILNLVMALKDAYMEIRRQLRSGRPVSKRAKQMRSNLLAILAADKNAHELGESFEAVADFDIAQLDLPFTKVDRPK
jgi:hypothetical protein